MAIADSKDKNFVESRKSTRVGCTSKISCTKYTYSGGAEECDSLIELTLINASAGGIGVLTDKTFEIESILTLKIELDGISYEKVTGKVAWGMKKSDKNFYGLEITNMSGRLYRHLSKIDNSITRLV